jgi:hypothetical protein
MSRPEEIPMNPFELFARLMTAMATCPLEDQWRMAVVAMAAFCLAGLLVLLPALSELPVTWLVRLFVPVLKVMRLLAGRSRDWRGALLDLLG